MDSDAESSGERERDPPVRSAVSDMVAVRVSVGESNVIVSSFESLALTSLVSEGVRVSVILTVGLSVGISVSVMDSSAETVRDGSELSDSVSGSVPDSVSEKENEKVVESVTESSRVRVTDREGVSEVESVPVCVVSELGVLVELIDAVGEKLRVSE